MHNLYPIEESQLVYISLFAFLCLLWLFFDSLQRFLKKVVSIQKGDTLDLMMLLGFFWNAAVVWASGANMLWVAGIVTNVLSKHIV